MSVIRDSISFLQALNPRNLSHINISQFKFRIRIDYFGLVSIDFGTTQTHWPDFNKKKIE